ncbi:hypothetical protein ALC56_09948, partial [Trachymyrmex septentrionalis]
HQDNAWVHMCPTPMAKFNEFHYKLLPHPAYSPDLTPYDYFVFPEEMITDKFFFKDHDELLVTRANKSNVMVVVFLYKDYASLFTNVPIELATENIVKRWDYIASTAILLNQFLIVVRFVMNSTFFSFNNNFYKQIFGTFIGSPLFPCSGVFLNFYSNHPLCHKTGVIMGTVDRIILLSNNGYPLQLICFTIHNRLNIALKMNSKLVYSIPNTLKNYIKKGNDLLDFFSHQDVVYKIYCENCNASYMGQTKRK